MKGLQIKGDRFALVCVENTATTVYASEKDAIDSLVKMLSEAQKSPQSAIDFENIRVYTGAKSRGFPICFWQLLPMSADRLWRALKDKGVRFSANEKGTGDFIRTLPPLE